ncbi:uncharacterized protein N0V89_004009 [Didymosphaeria variabile]|uniref:Uncharacterized protein n=1 Tax=Didymosphaeria variabile TaxID=1932322 RepID=A0A9W8XP40_9PLEO|nr:uncharacterized protein N0V89_004009 [Didymosphaeria variabile]KAJ4355984.1 hypothetical protein N0V89_004009 [Didymosphaeria variabile]
MPSQRGKRPSIVDGRILEPEHNLKPQTFGSFNQDTLARIAQEQAEEARNARLALELPNSQNSSPLHPPRTSSMNWSASTQSLSSQQPVSRRYYSSSLSDEDRTALAIGELNHNLSEWSGGKLVQYHVSRIELVPYTDKRQDIIADILDEKRGGERFMLKSTQQAKRFVGSPLTKLEMVKEVEAYNVQTRDEDSRSMVDLRTVSTPSLPLSPTSLAPQFSHESFPFPVSEAQNTRNSTSVGAGNNGLRPARNPVVQSPHTSESSRDSSRNRGRAWDRRPLVRKADRNPNRIRSSFSPPYVAKTDITFDTFLAPHASGKGETHRDSIVKKDEEPRNLPRRLSKMPSMPQLKKRASQAFIFGPKN